MTGTTERGEKIQWWFRLETTRGGPHRWLACRLWTVAMWLNGQDRGLKCVNGRFSLRYLPHGQYARGQLCAWLACCLVALAFRLLSQEGWYIVECYRKGREWRC